MPDVNSILEKCKSQKNKYNRTFKRLTIAFSCLIVAIMSVFLLTGGFNKQPVVSEKVEIVKIDQSDFMDSGIGCTPSIGFYGIEIVIYYDYTKHPKYPEWTVGLENGEAEMHPRFSYEYNVNRYYNQKIHEYEPFDIIFPNKLKSFVHLDSKIVITYISDTVKKQMGMTQEEIEKFTMEEAVEDMMDFVEKFYKLKDYENLLEYSTKDYIVKVEIAESWPGAICDAGLTYSTK